MRQGKHESDGQTPGPLSQPRRPRRGRYFARHPLIWTVIIFLGACCLAVVEAARAFSARHTVTHDWALGLAGGILIGAAALGYLAWLAGPGRPFRRYTLAMAPTIAIWIGTVVILRTTTPPGSQTGPHIVTTPLEAAELAYLAVMGAAFACLAARSGTRLIRKPRGLGLY